MTVCALTVCVLVAGASTATSALAAATASPGNSVTVSVNAQVCAPGWTAPRSGLATFTVVNATAGTPYRVQIMGASGPEVYGQLDMVAPGTRASFQALLPPGRYSIDCLSASGPS
ncbi:MAG TPA: hypothetical protein VFN61_00840, partial [Acidimicrobiales bacterium]|nr:hypothetical protein [Acidimicrobiales bacterium]